MTVDELLKSLTGAVVYDLEHPRHYGAPTFEAHQPGFLYSLHRRHEPGEGRTSASGVVVMAEHSGTHIDALCHQAYDMEMYGGVAVTPDVQTSKGFADLGIDTVAPIFSRGVLVDIPASRGGEMPDEEELLDASDLELAADGVEIRSGDVILIRTGNAARWQDPEAYLRGPGMSRDAAEWLAPLQPLAVGADNVAFDVVGHSDPDLGTLPAHTVLIVRHGVHIIENLLLDQLAEDGVNEFVFVCLPLKMRGVSGSPVRPVAMVT